MQVVGVNPLIYSDKSMWRKLRAKCHPDSGGQHELFIWVDELREQVSILAWKLESHADEYKKIIQENQELRERLAEYESCSAPYDDEPEESEIIRRISSLRRCHRDALIPLQEWAETWESIDSSGPATGKQIAYIAHLYGMDNGERYDFYDVCESIGLSKNGAGWLISHYLETE